MWLRHGGCGCATVDVASLRSPRGMWLRFARHGVASLRRPRWGSLMVRDFAQLPHQLGTIGVNMKKQAAILLCALYLPLSACSSDPEPAANSGEPVDQGSLDNGIPDEGTSNNTSGPDDCSSDADCNLPWLFYDPENVECKFVAATGGKQCIECESDAECPEHYRCAPPDQGHRECYLFHDKSLLPCESDIDCETPLVQDYYRNSTGVQCLETPSDGVLCVECLDDSDCPGECGTLIPYACTPTNQPIDLDMAGD